MSIGIYICYKKVVRGENCSDILSVGENDVYYTFIFKVLCKVYYYILYAMANAYCNISFLLFPPPSPWGGEEGEETEILQYTICRCQSCIIIYCYRTL